VVVPPLFLGKIFAAIGHDAATLFRVDLPQQLFTIVGSGESVPFEINMYKKECLMKGLDDIDYLLSMKGEIREFEKRGQ